MLDDRTLNSKINRSYNTCLRIIYNASAFTELLEIGNSISVHHRKIHVLAAELYKVINPNKSGLCGPSFSWGESI